MHNRDELNMNSYTLLDWYELHKFRKHIYEILDSVANWTPVQYDRTRDSNFEFPLQTNALSLIKSSFKSFFPKHMGEIEEYFDKTDLVIGANVTDPKAPYTIDRSSQQGPQIRCAYHDQPEDLVAQVTGRKRLYLYSADQEELLYPFRSYNNYQPCWFKPENPNYEYFPKARQAKRLSVVLNPGELLVQPAGWFHQVYALDSPNMSVSYFWRY